MEAPQSLLLVRIVEVEPAAELGLGPASWLLQLSLGGDVRSHWPGGQKEFAWEVSQLARRHLDLRVALRRKMLLGLSQFLGEVVIAFDVLLEQLRVGAVDVALWYDVVNGPRRRGRVKLSFRLAFSSRDSLDYLGVLHEQAVRLLREGGGDEEGLTESESVTTSHASRTVGLAGYEDTVARGSSPAAAAAGKATETVAEAGEEEAEEGFEWVAGPQLTQELRRVQVYAEESYASVRRGSRFGPELVRRVGRSPRLSCVLGKGEEVAETGLQLLDLMIAGVRNPAVVPDSFHEASVRLEQSGMGECEYAMLGGATLGALRAAEEAQGSWTDRVHFAWRAAYTLTARTLLELARPRLMRRGGLPPSLGCVGAPEAAAPRRCSFNSRFQTALEKIWKDAEDEAAWVEMAEVANDFEEAAQMYGRVIVLERFLPDHLKTIKPLYMGSIGGVKYCHGGLFFKLAAADGVRITSMEGAAKVAGHELKGCSCYFQVGIAGLHVPLTSCIDFAGFRLVAMCELPISSRSLAVGTADGGATLVASDPRLLLQLRAAARVLNLKDHPVGRLTLSSAADLEGHLSPLDQRRYLVDFSRVMPPHPAATKPGAGEARFVALLRPELVQQSSEPLNPDVGSGFRRAGSTVDDPDDLRGLSVAGEMLNKFCLAVAKELSAQAAAAAATPQGLSGLPEQLSRLFHSHGVNMRMLGVVLAHVTHPAARRVLLVEMGARVIKRIMRARWREVMVSADYVMSGPLLRAAAACFTDVFCSATFWGAEVYPAMQSLFSFSLSPAELAIALQPDEEATNASFKSRRETARALRGRIVSAPAVFGKEGAPDPDRADMSPWVPLRDNSGLRALLFARLCQQLCIQFAPRACEVYLQPDLRLPAVPLDAADVVSLQPRLKSLKIVAQSRAMALVARAPLHADRAQLVTMVSTCFERALEGPLISSQLLRSYAECLAALCPREQGPGLLASQIGDRVEALFRRAVQINARDAEARFAYAQWRELCGDDEGARLHLLRCVMLAPRGPDGPPAYLRLLRRLKLSREASAFEEAMGCAHAND